MDVATLQNEPDSIALLISQRCYYSRVKVIRLFILGITVFVAVSGIIVTHFSSSYSNYVGGLGALTLLVIFLLSRWEKSLVLKAANIQEQFDTKVFGLAWNQELCGTKLSKEQIYKVSNSYAGTQDEFYNWYTNVDEVVYPYNVLVSQRQNMAWDVELRECLVYCIKFLMISLIVIAFGFGCYLELRLPSFLLGVIAPTVPIFLVLLKEINHHQEVVKARSCWISKLEDSFNSKDVDINYLRRVQDTVYQTRLKQAYVPDILYKVFRNKYETAFYASHEEFKARFPKN